MFTPYTKLFGLEQTDEKIYKNILLLYPIGLSITGG